MQRWIPFEIFFRQTKERTGRLEPRPGCGVFLQVDKGAGELNQTLIESVIGLSSLPKPQLFQHVMGFVKQSAIEAVEEAEIMRIQSRGITTKWGDASGDFWRFVTHASGGI